MARIKRASTDEGGYFDPHTHFTGIVHYRALAALTPEGRTLLRFWRPGNAGTALAKTLTDLEIEDFLAHHTARAALKPPYLTAVTDEQRELARGLYDLETRLLVLQNIALGWTPLPDSDLKRIADNADTFLTILAQGFRAVDAVLGPHHADVAKLVARPTLPPDTSRPAKRPSAAEIEVLVHAILAMEIDQSSEDGYQRGLPKIVRHANQNVLTATPQNDYDSAYVARGLLDVSPRDLLAAGMRELRRQNITYSEQSVPLWSLEKWRDKQDDPATPAVRAYEAGGTVVRWLPMLVGTFLGWTGEPAARNVLRMRTTVPTSTETRRKLPETALTAVTPYDDWTPAWAESAPTPWPPVSVPGAAYDADVAAWVKKLTAALQGGVPYATGFDIASPERTWYTPAGAKLLQALLWDVFTVAFKARRRLVAHVHVGEGYPAFVKAGQRTTEGGAKRSEQSTLPILYDPVSRLPAHYLCAENNVEQTLRAVVAVRRKAEQNGMLAAFDEYVRVRFGHVTHATLLQAQQMAENNIWADVNLTSNLATGAISLTSPTENVVVSPTNPRLIKWAADTVAEEENAELFKHHALVTLLACRVPTVLGTDGGGIEHSFMEREYALAKAILDQASALVGARAFTMLSSAKKASPVDLTEETARTLARRLDVGRLYEYQSAHHAWATSSDPAETVVAHDEDLDYELRNVFIRSVAGGFTKPLTDG